MQTLIENALVAIWPKLEPLLMRALCNVARAGLNAIKAKSVPADSPFKVLEGVADELIDTLLSALPA